MDQINNKGLWRGQCLFIKKNNRNSYSFEIAEEGLSVLEIKFNNEILMLMGVYLASVASNIDQKIIFESQLLVLSQKSILV
jgi:hypothetical protein